MAVCEYCVEEYNIDDSDAVAYTLFCSPECEVKYDENGDGMEYDDEA
jgi:hypothetical protein